MTIVTPGFFFWPRRCDAQPSRRDADGKKHDGGRFGDGHGRAEIGGRSIINSSNGTTSTFEFRCWTNQYRLLIGSPVPVPSGPDVDQGWNVDDGVRRLIVQRVVVGACSGRWLFSCAVSKPSHSEYCTDTIGLPLTQSIAPFLPL